MGVEGGTAVPRVGAGVAVWIAHRSAAFDQLANARRGRHLLHPARERLHSIRRLDADHVSAPLGEQLRNVRAGPDHSDLCNADAFERQRLVFARRGSRPTLTANRQSRPIVFVQERRTHRGRTRCRRHLERPSGIGETPSDRMFQLVPGAALPIVRIGHDVGDGVERARQQAVRLGFLHGFALRPLRQPVGVKAFKHLLPCRIDVQRVHLIRARCADHRQEPRQSLDAGAHDVDVTIGTAAYANTQCPPDVGQPATAVAGVGRDGQLDAAPVSAPGLAFENGQVDPVAVTGLLGPRQRHRRRQRRRESGVVQRVMAAKLQRLALGMAIAHEGAADGLESQFRSSVVAVRTCLAEGRDGDHHQPGIGVGNRLEAPAPALGLARSEILNQHVGTGRQVANPACVSLGVKQNRSLVAVKVQEQTRSLRMGIIVRERAEAAARVSPRGLNLHNIRPELRQQIAGIGTGNMAAQVHHAHTVKWRIRCVGHCASFA